MADDAKALIELATRRFIEEVPALEPIKLIVSVELRGRGDVQQFRLQMPEVTVTKGPASDASVRTTPLRCGCQASVATRIRIYAAFASASSGSRSIRCASRTHEMISKCPSGCSTTALQLSTQSPQLT